MGGKGINRREGREGTRICYRLKDGDSYLLTHTFSVK